MKPWTDLQALAVAIQHTKSRADAAALIATWRTPRREPEPRGFDLTDEQREDVLPVAVGGRMVLGGILDGMQRGIVGLPRRRAA